ncbi:hypothetical protein MJL79_30365, partial [Salmonella enterica subsp. enterica serovar Montevideo]|nr:hypothetical protein [Salmonella enterica subsp. enterica serovar Montevideo]
MLRAADLFDSLGQENNPEWKTVAINSNGEMVAVFFGVTVKLPDLITKSHLPLDDSIRVWLDQNNHLLPFSYIPQ